METSIVTLVINLVNKILDQIPNAEQRERNKWKELVMEFNYEINKPIEQWDADRIMNIKDEILVIGERVSK